MLKSEHASVATIINQGPDRAFAERRPKPRKSVLMAGVVSYDGGKHGFDCTIRDLSETGARICIPRNVTVPSGFFLISIRDRLAYDVQTVWQNGLDVGLSVAKTRKLTDIADPALAFLKRVWLERATR